MKIALASDHGGFNLKEELKNYLSSKGFDVQDFGADSDEPSDYPDFAKKAVASIINKSCERAILVCGSGVGMCITANRFKGIRAAVLRGKNDAVLCRKHNDINIACLGGRFTNFDQAKEIADAFVSESFEGGRHEIRIKKIDL